MLPLPVQVWLAADAYEGKNDNTHISATTLLKDSHKIVLENKVEKNYDTSDEALLSKFASRRGTAIHSSLEYVWKDDNLRNKALDALGLNELKERIVVNQHKENPNQIEIWLEMRAYKTIDNMTVNGQFDMVMDGQVVDYKNTSVFTYMHGSKIEDYKLQGSIYRWLNPNLITNDKIKIIYIMHDWTSRDAKINSDYPQTPVIAVDYDLYSLDYTENFIKNKIQEIQNGGAPECVASLKLSDPVWQYFSKPDSKRAAKNFTNQTDANHYVMTKGKGFIKMKPRVATGCKYCTARSICTQYQNLLLQGLVDSD